MSKTTPWNKIKAEYLKGSSPKELAQKYSLKPKAISNKATIEKWAGQRKQIKANVSKNIEEEINDGAKEAINLLKQTQINILGTVYTMVDTKENGYYTSGHYSNYYLKNKE